MNVAEHIKSMRAVAAAYEEKLTDNHDFQAWKAINEAIAHIERGAKGTKEAHQPRKHERSKTSEPSRLDLSADILIRNGYPVPTTGLVKTIEAQGVELGGKDPHINLASSLSRSERFRSVTYKGQRAWWLTDRPYPGELTDEPIEPADALDFNQSLTKNNDESGAM